MSKWRTLKVIAVAMLICLVSTVRKTWRKQRRWLIQQIDPYEVQQWAEHHDRHEALKDLLAVKRQVVQEALDAYLTYGKKDVPDSEYRSIADQIRLIAG